MEHVGVFQDINRGLEHKVTTKMDRHEVFVLIGSDIEFMDELALYLEGSFKTVFIRSTGEKKEDLEMEIRNHLCATPVCDLKLTYY